MFFLCCVQCQDLRFGACSGDPVDAWEVPQAQIHSAASLCALMGFLFFDSGVGCMEQSPYEHE